MEKEIWKPSPSYPDFSASSWGRVMKNPYQAPMPHGGMRRYGGIPTFGVWAKNDRRFIVVSKSKTPNAKTFRVARIVCDAFHGPAKDGQVCMHLDENSQNNRPENLAWGSQEENLNAPGFKSQRRFSPRRLTDKQVEEIRQSTERPCDLARLYGVKPCTISNIRSGRLRKVKK